MERNVLCASGEETSKHALVKGWQEYPRFPVATRSSVGISSYRRLPFRLMQRRSGAGSYVAVWFDVVRGFKLLDDVPSRPSFHQEQAILLVPCT
jgi:hypothetical protein